MPGDLYLGVDVGTGSGRAALFDDQGRKAGQSVQEIRIWRPQEDFAEQSSEDIWGAAGRAVRTALAEATLKKIADVTDGQYFNANTEADLRTVYENLTTELVVRNEKTELTAYATLAAAILAVFAGAFSLLWFNRLP